MAQTSYYWGGTVTGDASLAPYSDDEFSDIWRRMFQRNRAYQGVIGGYANALAVTNPAGNTARVASGAAFVDGKFYENTANVDFAVPNGDYAIVLRKTWATQQVRLALIGPGPGVPPTPTQNDGVVWEIIIADMVVGGGAFVSLYDRRRYVFRGPSRRVLVPVRDAADALGRCVWDTLGWTLKDNQYSNVWAEWFVPNDYYANLKINPLVVANSPAVGNIYLPNWYVLFGPWQIALCNSDTWGDYNVLDGSLVAHPLGITDAIICGPELDFSVDDIIRPNDYMHFQFSRDGTHISDTLNDDCYIQGFMLEYDSIT